MANKFTRPQKEKKKLKKNPFKASMRNGKITKKKAMYDSQLVGMSPSIPVSQGY